MEAVLGRGGNSRLGWLSCAEASEAAAGSFMDGRGSAGTALPSLFPCFLEAAFGKSSLQAPWVNGDHSNVLGVLGPSSVFV